MRIFWRDRVSTTFKKLNITARCLGLVHWDDPEGWCGEGGGRGFRMGSVCIPVVDSF